jgi:hypothetical protein
VAVDPRLVPQYRGPEHAITGRESQRQHRLRICRIIRVPRMARWITSTRNCATTLVGAGTNDGPRYKISIAKPSVTQRPSVHPATCRAGDRRGGRDVTKVGDIASDSRRHRDVRRWASDHHHVRLLRHGWITPDAKERAFSAPEIRPVASPSTKPIAAAIRVQKPMGCRRLD